MANTSDTNEYKVNQDADIEEDLKKFGDLYIASTIFEASSKYFGVVNLVTTPFESGLTLLAIVLAQEIRMCIGSIFYPKITEFRIRYYLFDREILSLDI